MSSQIVAQRAARLAEGHIGIAKLYATDERVMSDRDELVVGVLGSGAVPRMQCCWPAISSTTPRPQAEADANRITAGQEADFRRINGLGTEQTASRRNCVAHSTQIAKKDDVKRSGHPPYARRAGSCAELGRLHLPRRGGAAEQRRGLRSGLINLENRSSIAELSVRLNRAGAVTRLEDSGTARRKRLAGNGNPLLVFEALFCALIS